MWSYGTRRAPFMPELSRFYGIVVRRYYRDHAPPHLHAEYGSAEVLLDLNSLAVLEGSLPPRAHGLLVEWASQHRSALNAAWEQARRLEAIDKIPSLP